MARQVKSIAFAYLFHSLIQVTEYTTVDHHGPTAANLQRTGERDSGGLRKKFSRGERAVENNPRLYCITKLAQNFKMKFNLFTH